MKACLIIGHKAVSAGASNPNCGAKEFIVNESIVNGLVARLHGGKEISDLTEVIPVYRTTTFRDLPGQINSHDPKFAISLHCNAFNTRASGSETLYYHSSKNGKAMANISQTHFAKHLGLNDRGVLPRHSEDRGGLLLRYTKCPIILCEPFFIDNDKDFSVAMCGGGEVLSNCHIDTDLMVKCYIDILKDITQLFI